MLLAVIAVVLHNFVSSTAVGSPSLYAAWLAWGLIWILSIVSPSTLKSLGPAMLAKGPTRDFAVMSIGAALVLRGSLEANWLVVCFLLDYHDKSNRQ
jgi:hypothetical protein